MFHLKITNLLKLCIYIGKILLKTWNPANYDIFLSFSHQIYNTFIIHSRTLHL